ncbi:MFS general substrate transporter [Didymella exigua CBS 183.55]|uniref:MFS general substrate transporter n=1 Tax=Didymella exigua CBS 183.55 TaxID=1150837 RepID=A0A6A5RGV6_9PLEO|nr:MFS general substrate transporter [Didymella exigua CBS 183.55]KAF1926723.1 MFS general substrate transporter [Didymella exigua CBS 183.55]
MSTPDPELGSCPPPLSISDHDEKDPNARPACFKSTLQECLFVLSVTMAVAMTSVLTGSITVMSSFAAKDLNMTNAQVTWMNAACSLSAGALLLFFGSIADLFGRKSMFIGSMVLFSIVCLGTGFAKDGITVDVLCGILGIFSASAVPPAQGVLGTIYDRPSRRKNRAFGCFSAGNPLGFVFGTILSGLFTQLFNWRAGFFLIAITYFITSIVAYVTVPTDTMPKQKLDAETLRRLDLPGTGMTIAGIGMFCAALSLAGDAPNGWKTPYVLVLLLVGLLLIGAFIAWELKYPYAIVDMNVFKDRDFSLLLLILSFGFLGFPVFSFWLALYFQVELGYNALMTGVHMLPMVVVGLLANFIAAVIQHKVSNKRIMGIGAWAYVGAFVLAAVQRKGDSYWAFSFPALCLCVIGADFEFIVANMYVLSSMPANKQSIAGSLLQTLTRLCTAVGYGIATAIFDTVERNPPKSGYYANNAVAPYAAVFWFALGVCFLAVLFVPFLRITTQGHTGDRGRVKHDIIEPPLNSALGLDDGHAVAAVSGEERAGIESTLKTL